MGYDEAREAAARAADDYFSGADRAYGEHVKCANAAIDAFLAKLSADSEMVERVAKLIHAATDKVHAWCADEADGSYLLHLGREEYRVIARAAIAAMLDQKVKP